MGMEGIIPTMPQFREPDGRLDWRQIWDMVIPGNAYDSRTNQWRPQGMVAGAIGSVVPFGDVATEAIYANRDRFRMPSMPNFRNPFSGFGNWLRGRTGNSADIGRGVSTPESFYRDRQRMYDQAMSNQPPTSTERWLNGSNDASGQQFVDSWNNANRPRPTPMRDGRGGYNGRSWASARGVGQGMRRTNEQALQEVMEQMERWRNRGGLMQER